VWFVDHPEAIAGAFDAASQKKVMSAILTAIEKHQVETKGVGAVAPALADTTNLRCRKILEKIRQKNPNPVDQGLAAMGLALHMQEHNGMRQDDPRINGIRLKYIREAIIKSYDEAFGKRKVSDYTTELLYDINTLSLRRKAPSFELQTADGTSVKTPDGQTTLLVFWSPKVPASASFVEQAPALLSKHPDVVIRPVCYTPNDPTATPSTGDSAPPSLIDKQGEVFKLFRIVAVPSVYLLDSEGVIRMRGVPDMMFQTVLDQAMSNINAAGTSGGGAVAAPKTADVVVPEAPAIRPIPAIEENSAAPATPAVSTTPTTDEPQAPATGDESDEAMPEPLTAPPLRPIPGM
jgi:hypothetical protein